jgi:exodeoxyribonuclease-3
MKIATYNVNSIKSRLGLLIQWLEKRGGDIDVLCLQELKVTDEAFPYGEFERLGYNCTVSGQRAYNGVAICSKTRPQWVIKNFGVAELDGQKRLIAANINGIVLYSVYAPHGDERGSEKFNYKLRWYEALRGFLSQQSQDLPTLLAGDFNVALNDLDVYDPVALEDTIGTMKEEREALKKVLQMGFIDSFRHLHPEQRGFSWWAYTGGAVWKDQGMRIDYILCSAPLVKCLKSVEIDQWPRRRRTPIPSDHTPVIAEFAI